MVETDECDNYGPPRNNFTEDPSHTEIDLKDDWNFQEISPSGAIDVPCSFFRKLSTFNRHRFYGLELSSNIDTLFATALLGLKRVTTYLEVLVRLPEVQASVENINVDMARLRKQVELPILGEELLHLLRERFLCSCRGQAWFCSVADKCWSWPTLICFGLGSYFPKVTWCRWATKLQIACSLLYQICRHVLGIIWHWSIQTSKIFIRPSILDKSRACRPSCTSSQSCLALWSIMRHWHWNTGKEVWVKLCQRGLLFFWESWSEPERLLSWWCT